MVDISREICKLVEYALYNRLIEMDDVIYSRNRVLEVLGLDDFTEMALEDEKNDNVSVILENILNWAFENGKLESNSAVYRDLLDTKIMDCFIPRPSEIIRKFKDLSKFDKVKATDYYYNLSKASNYIRTDRIAKNLVWKSETEYGDLDITINLSKPEKDPKAIAAARNMKSSSYPKCLLCKENEGYAGRINHPARQNHRIVPIELMGDKWFIQYSPYVYYNEHCIVFRGEHVPMKISKSSFDRLLQFVDELPHYFVGSNADLPIVGGSILSHDHFQGGHYKFAMEKATIEEEIVFEGYEDISSGIVKWPMSVIRLSGMNKEKIASLGEKILNKWREYSDKKVDIIAYSEETPHNTVTPIARRRGELFELDLVLRNNRTTEEHPLGIFHPHSEVHHIKKENIGLIEVMGLAVLPARLKEELKDLEQYLIDDSLDIMNNEEIAKHRVWAEEIKDKYSDIDTSNVEEILRKEVGIKFMKVLEHAGVYKRNDEGKEAFSRFVSFVNEK
ncbi:UDP-glucose--hexose-1-phosphate uridylyltransferase [Clostridium sp. DL1XJH146]